MVSSSFMVIVHGSLCIKEKVQGVKIGEFPPCISKIMSYICMESRDRMLSWEDWYLPYGQLTAKFGDEIKAHNLSRKE